MPVASAARHPLVAPALRFLVAGGLNAALNFALFRAFLHLLGGQPSAAGVAQAGAYAIGVTVGYVVNRRWTFRNGGAAEAAAHRRALPRFLAAYLGTLALSTALIQTGVMVVGLSPNLAWVLATGVTTVVNFVAQRYWVFPERPASVGR